eukprot:15458670-Alexandrium_andersonii.AAC.1
MAVVARTCKMSCGLPMALTAQQLVAGHAWGHPPTHMEAGRADTHTHLYGIRVARLFLFTVPHRQVCSDIGAMDSPPSRQPSGTAAPHA